MERVVLKSINFVYAFYLEAKEFPSEVINKYLYVRTMAVTL